MITKAHLMVYSDTLGTREEVTDFVKNTKEIKIWRYDMPNSFYLISDKLPADLSTLVRNHFGEKGRFLITEVSDNCNGWLPPEAWYLLNNKKLKPKETT